MNANAASASIDLEALGTPGTPEAVGVDATASAEIATWWSKDRRFPADRLASLLRLGGRATVWVPREGRSHALALPQQRILRRVLAALGASGFAIVRSAPDPEQPQLERVVAQRTEYGCRYYRPGDEQRIIELFTRCFGPHRTLEHWQWKFRDNPYANELIALCETSEERLVTHYAGFGVPILRVGESGPERHLAMQMGDTMSDPEMRSVGRRQTALLPRVVRHFFARFREQRFGFYFGFNRGPIQRFCRWFIGGDVVEPVGYWQRDAEWSAESEARTPAVAHLEVREEQPGSEWDEFLYEVSTSYRLLVRRDAEYLRWRYLACPDRDYVLLAVRELHGEPRRLLGWGVFRREGDVLQWGDLLVRPEATACVGQLLRAAQEHPALRGAERIEAWFSQNPEWLRKAIEDLGFERSWHPQGLAMVALANPPDFTLGELGQMYTTWGDSDLY